jgi:hypothetical protein
MNKILRNILRFVVIILLQVLVFDNINLWGYLTPYVYLFLLLSLRIDINKTLLLFIGFFTGLTVDIFQNTLGIQAAAATLLVFARPYVINLYFNKTDFSPSDEPDINKLKFSGYVKYIFTLLFLHHFLLFFLEAFSFSHILDIVKDAFYNTVLTGITILITEMLLVKRQRG